MRKLTHPQLLARQKEHLKELRLPLCVLLNNIRSAHNVGSIFRTADGAGVEKIYLCGITGYPPNAQIAKTALGAQNHVPWEYRKDVIPVVRQIKDNGYQLVLLEQTSQSIPYQKFRPRGPLCLVIGNEVEGVAQQIADLCDRAVEIEMAGLKNSLNVSVACGIAIYHLANGLRVLKWSPTG